MTLVACGKGDKLTLGDLRKNNAELATSLANGIDGTLAAVMTAPQAEVGAPCERKGLTKAVSGRKGDTAVAARDPVDGNTELTSVEELERGLDPSKQHPGAFEYFLGEDQGPALTTAAWFRSRDDGARMSADSQQELDRARSVKQVVAIKLRKGMRQADVFLVEFPAGKIACGFRVADGEPPPYDPKTGDPMDESTRAMIAADSKDFFGALNEQLAQRFGIRMARQDSVAAPTRTPEQERLRAVHGKMLAALATPEYPACSGPAPAGSVRTTTKRLRIYAGMPVPSFKDSLGDVNVTVEPSDAISEDFRKYLARNEPAASRDESVKRLIAAPATLVIDVERENEASFGASNGTFEPGTVVARQVQFAPDGTPVCQTRVTLTNSASISVSYRAGGNIGSISLVEAARADLRQQLAKAFP